MYFKTTCTHTTRIICRGCYRCSYTCTMMAIKPMKTLELHYPMIQFLINQVIQVISAIIMIKSQEKKP